MWPNNLRTRNQAQRIIPSLRFDCDGAITKWIVRASSWRSNRNAFPDLQLWRNSSRNGVYTKVGNTTLIIAESNASQLYEIAVEPSLPFQRGDILGIFQPSGSRSRLRILYRTGSGNPRNYVVRLAGSVTEPPLETFTTSSSGVRQESALPLVTMEICKACIKYLFGFEQLLINLAGYYCVVMLAICQCTCNMLSIMFFMSTATSMTTVTQLLLTATARVELSPTSTISSQFFPSTSTPGTFHLSSTPATSHLSSTPATSHLSSTPATSHLLSTPATFLTSGTPVSPMTSVSSPSSELDNMEGSFSVSTVGTVAGVGGSFLLAVIIVVLVITVLLLFRRRKKYFVSSDTDEHILHNPTYGN